MVGNIRFIIVALLFSGAIPIYGKGNVKEIKGRLLTPEEGCGLTKVKNTRIIGGSKAPVGAYPWIVILGYNRKNKIDFECGGSLITSRHILTAAHCIENDLHIARLGEHDLSTTDDGPHQDIRIIHSVKHRFHVQIHKLNDIAISHLERDVEFSDRIRPICLPLDQPLRSRDFVDSNAFIAGWGYMLETGCRADILMQLQIPVVDTQTCRDLHLKDGVDKVKADIMINEHVICAGGIRRKGFFRGDSGGPLMLPIHQNGTFPFYQIGVISFSWGCARENVPGVYSKVQYHADWIKKQLKQSTDNKKAKGFKKIVKNFFKTK